MPTSYNSNLIPTGLSAGLQIGRSRQSAKRKVGLIEASGALANNDVLVYCLIPVDAVVPSIRFACDDLGTTGTINFGLYPATKAIWDKVIAGTLLDTDAVDEDCFATAVDVNAAAVAPTDIRIEVAAARLDGLHKPAWEVAGLSAKPATYTHFFVCGTMAAATDAGGSTMLDVTVA